MKRNFPTKMVLRILPPAPQTPAGWISRLSEYADQLDEAHKEATTHPCESNTQILAHIGPRIHKAVKKFYYIARDSTWDHPALVEYGSLERAAFVKAAIVMGKLYYLRDIWDSVKMGMVKGIKLDDDAIDWWRLEEWARELGEAID